MKKILLAITVIGLMSSCNSVDLQSIDMDRLDNKQFSSIIEKTEIQKVVATEKGDVGGGGAWACKNKLVLYPNGRCDYTIGEDVTDFGANKTTSGNTYKGSWNIDKEASMYGKVSECIGNDKEYTRLVVTLDNGIKSTALMYKDGTRFRLIDCDNRVQINGNHCEQLNQALLIIPFSLLITSMSF